MISILPQIRIYTGEVTLGMPQGMAQSEARTLLPPLQILRVG